MREVSRRRYMKTTAAGGLAATAGCIYLPYPAPNAAADAGETKAVDGNPIQELRVASFPERVPFSGTLEVLRQPSRTGPGILHIALRNQAETTWQVQVNKDGIPFPRAYTDSLYLGRYDHDNIRYRDGCHRPTGVDHGTVDTHTFQPGDRVQGRRQLVTDTDSPCYPAGDHDFRAPFTAAPAPADITQDDQFPWGFTLILD